MTRVVTQVACNTSAGTQVIPLPDGLTDPKAFRFWLAPGTTNGTPVDHMILGYGVAARSGTGYTQQAISIRSRHNVGSTNERRYAVAGYCIHLLTSSTNFAQAAATITAADAGSVTINWVTAPGSAYRLMVEAIDCVAAVSGQFSLPATVGGTTTETTGFEFDLLYVATTGRRLGR